MKTEEEQKFKALFSRVIRLEEHCGLAPKFTKFAGDCEENRELEAHNNAQSATIVKLREKVRELQRATATPEAEALNAAQHEELKCKDEIIRAQRAAVAGYQDKNRELETHVKACQKNNGVQYKRIQTLEAALEEIKNFVEGVDD